MVSVNEATDWSMKSGNQSQYSVYCLLQLIKDVVSVSNTTDWSMRSGTQYSILYIVYFS